MYIIYIGYCKLYNVHIRLLCTIALQDVIVAFSICYNLCMRILNVLILHESE